MKTPEIEDEQSVLPFLALKSSEIMAEVSDIDIPQIVVDSTSFSESVGDTSSKKGVVIHEEFRTSEESLQQRKHQLHVKPPMQKAGSR